VPVWDRALRIDPNFVMALGNKGCGLMAYAGHLYDPGHRGVFFWPRMKLCRLRYRGSLNTDSLTTSRN
jgi:hypothetical protein